jgi:hypothetical protein
MMLSCSVRYSSHSNSSVTTGRFSSLWTWDQSGSGRAGFSSNVGRSEKPLAISSRTLKKTNLQSDFLYTSATTKKVTSGDRRDIEGLAAILHRF